MGTTTRWIDRKTADLDDAVRLLIDSVEPDEKVKTIVWDNWHFDKILSGNREITLNGRNISYNMIRPAHKIGRLWRFQIQEVDDWVRKKGNEGGKGKK